MAEDITGLWELKKTIVVSSGMSVYYIPFKIGTINYRNMQNTKNTLVYTQADGTTKTVYQNSQWVDNKYRNIEIMQGNPDGSAINFIKDNANRVKHVKLKDGTTVLYPATKATLIQNDGVIECNGIQHSGGPSGMQNLTISGLNTTINSMETTTIGGRTGVKLPSLISAPLLGTDTTGKINKIIIGAGLKLIDNRLSLCTTIPGNLSRGLHFIWSNRSSDGIKFINKTYRWIIINVAVTDDGKYDAVGIGWEMNASTYTPIRWIGSYAGQTPSYSGDSSSHIYF